MLQNYLKTAWRNLVHNKVYSLLNILGLATGTAVALLIGLWVQHEISYDSFHVNKKQIGIVMKKTFFNNEKGTQTGVMLPLYEELKKSYPDVKRATRLDWGDWRSMAVGEKKISSRGHFADPDFLTMFSFPLVKGSAASALNDPYSIVLTESTAKSLFGNTDPIGKMVRLNDKFDVKVTAVAKDVPTNSTIQFTYLLPYELNILTNDFVRGAKTDWGNNFLQTFVELKAGVSMESFSKKIELLAQQKLNDKKEAVFFMHAMKKWHLHNEYKNWVNVGGFIEYVRLFSIIGILVLVIACINFMNLSTARSEKRAREVGIRKAVGSHRKQLVVQFLGESLLTTFIAFILAIVIAKLCLPLLADIGFRNVTFNPGNMALLAILLGGCIVTGLLAGSYPAIYLSRFSAVKVLKGTFQVGKAANLPRRILVVTQFSVSIALIIGTIIVFQQIQHGRNRPLGYNPNNLIGLYLSENLAKNYDVLKQELLNTGYVEAVSKSSSPMTGVWNEWGDFSWEGKDPNTNHSFSAIMVDYDYDKVAGIAFKEGRFFSKQFATDSNSAILNEAAVKLIGFKDPVGKTIKMDEEALTVIGVTQNTVRQDPFKSVMPAIMLLRSYFVSQLFIRFNPTADIHKALATLKPIVEKHNPNNGFVYNFVDEEFARKFQGEEQIGKLSGIFAALAIFISCLGLFGLASFMAERRTKEIGVRKVLGATVTRLWLMLSKDFVLLVIISCLIASPLAWYFLKDWLQQYEYRITITPWVFIGAAAIAIVITLVTVSFQAVRAALANPVKSLRSE